MPNLAPIDLMILLIFYFFAVSIGVGIKAYIPGANEFLLAGRRLPGWLCGLAFAGASVGSLELLAMGAAGARYGLVSGSFFGLGAVIPLLFAALFLVPAYYASKAKSLPEYLGLRFDRKTRTTGAVLQLLALLLAAAFTLYAMARVSAGLRLLNAMFHLENVSAQGQLGIALVVPAAIVLVYVALGGLGAAMYVQVMQFFVLLAGFLPMVFLGLKQVGGWGGMKAAFATTVVGHAGVPRGPGALVEAMLLGALMSAGVMCTDMSLLQTALAAENQRSARRAALIAATWKALLPFLLVLPGVLVVCMSTPHTAITISNNNGEIVHEINVVPHAVEQGMGLVPAQTDSVADPMSGNVLKDAGGKPLIDYSMATPSLLPKNMPTGLLGFGLAALLACLTSGLAARITAFNTVFVYDVYQAGIRGNATEKHLLAVSRWTTLAVVAIAAGLAWGALHIHSMPDVMDILAVLSAVFFTPMLVTFVLGAVWKRTTACAAFAGLLTGFIAAAIHWGLTVPVGYSRGFAGGWLHAGHHPRSFLAQQAGSAMFAILSGALVTVVVSLMSRRKAEAELAGLLHTWAPSNEKFWWKRPTGAAVAIALLALLVSLIFAWS